MHFHLPKPLHGWRQLAGEVGIIVLGVLIALSAEQFVSNMTWRIDVRDFRSAVDAEFEFNLAAGEYRVRQSPCLERRLAELKRWSADQRAGRAVPLRREIDFPRRIYPDDAVWNARGADLPAHLPIQARLAYSDLSDLVGNQWEQIQAERETWLSLNGFNHVTQLGPADLIRLDELLFRATTLNDLIKGDQNDLGADAAMLGLRPSFGSFAGQISPPQADFCRPLLPPDGKRA